MTPETAIKHQIRDYLGCMGWYTFPIVQNAFSYKGIADVIACKKGVVLFVECKTPKSKQTPHQAAFERDITAAGCHYLIARSWEDVSAYIGRLA